MGTTIFLGALLLIGFILIAVFGRIKTNAKARAKAAGREAEAFSENGYGYVPVSLAFIPIVLALIIGAFACTAVVEAKTQGVLLTFGKPSDRTLDPGLNLKLPWQKVVTIDTTRQTDSYNDGNGDNDHGVISVRLGNGNVSSVYAAVTWQVNDEQANTVYGEFRGDDPTQKVYDNLIRPNFKSAVNSVFGTYNPTAEISKLAEQQEADPSITQEDINLAPDFDTLASDVEKNFLKRVGYNEDGSVPSDGPQPLVKILAVQVSFLSFDADTQKKINEYQDEVQKTIIAAQAVKTAEKLAEANDKISASISQEPNVLVSRCLDLIASGDLVPPAGFSCWANSGSSVVIPATK